MVRGGGGIGFHSGASWLAGVGTRSMAVDIDPGQRVDPRGNVVWVSNHAEARFTSAYRYGSWTLTFL